MRIRLVAANLVAVCAIWVGSQSATPTPAAIASVCSSVTVGLDTSLANSSGGAFLGEAPGQTFLAADTLVRSVTVWRVASEDTNYMGMHLYITKTDSAGTPETDQVILDGPTVYNYFGDGIHPIPFQFVMEPPVVLPGPGLYAFFLREEPCSLGYFDLIGREETSGGDIYPPGHVWLTRRSNYSGCVLKINPNSYPLADFIFSIEFCQTTTTPTLSPTWGALKAHYR